MSDNKITIRLGGGFFFPVLQLIFITLKLCKVITWSWWIVLLPIEIPAVIIIAVLCFLLLIFILALIFSK